MRAFSFVIIISLICSCKNENLSILLGEPTVFFSDSEFEKYEILKSEHIAVISDSLFRPSTILVIDDKYLVISDIAAKKALHLYDALNDNYIMNFGERGFGPGEIQVPWKLYQPESNTVGVYDIEQNKTLESDILSISLGMNDPKEIKLPAGVNSNGVTRIKERLFFFDSNNDDGRLFYYDMSEMRTQRIGTFPNFEKQYPQFSKSELREKIGFAKLVNRGSLFALSHYNVPLIQIYHADLDEWISIFGPDELPAQNLLGKTVFYGSVFISEKYIYKHTMEERIHSKIHQKPFIFSIIAVSYKKN
ncbi:hypothetical protein B879_00778 [Cecembia lonarensis LW9]|uniref:6-bladed beta-propeller n=1 Tax=Cecembia lonarensis (strain CCUG 58316 / KCTC 22772 / LW9) TaxID=1225176 RepID=K1L2C9_CECL9|nr:hypothetical protein B879_00778 [Cecembia lonarensis LW9]